MVVDNGVLYHLDKIAGYPVKQLCVPESRRLEVMRLADQTLTGERRKQRKELKCHSFGPICVNKYGNIVWVVLIVNAEPELEQQIVYRSLQSSDLHCPL